MSATPRQVAAEAAQAFLAELGRALSALTLYGSGHQATVRVEESVLERLRALKAVEPYPTITFLEGEVVLNQRPLRELRDWSWGERLTGAGVQRIEFPGEPSLEDLTLFMEEVTQRLTRKRSLEGDEGPRAEEVRTGIIGRSIRFGRVGLDASRVDEAPVAQVAVATLDLSLDAEAEAMEWLQTEAREGRGLHLAEAEAVVRSLAVAARGHEHVLAALLRPGGGGAGNATGSGDAGAWASTHAMNVSVLSMALAEFMGMDSRAVRSVGVAGLLHDLGTMAVPDRILVKPDTLTREERALVETHPEAGARLILRQEERLDLAAVVAYEHHVRYDGTGYPRFRFPRPLHPVSHLVHVCATFDTLLHDRPWRPRWSEAEALRHLEEGAGTEFHPEFARDFVRMIRLERRL